MTKQKKRKEIQEASDLSIIGAIAQIGEIFCEDQKSKNDWKLRMLKAGLEHRGLQVPPDWDELSEDEKERRLNKVIEVAGGKDDRQGDKDREH